MTREEIVNKLKEMHANGYTYKGIAQAAGLETADQLYKFLNRAAPAKEVMRLLETYLRQLEDEGSRDMRKI